MYRETAVHYTCGAIGNDADPSSMLTPKLPSLSRSIASDDEFIT